MCPIIAIKKRYSVNFKGVEIMIMNISKKILSAIMVSVVLWGSMGAVTRQQLAVRRAKLQERLGELEKIVKEYSALKIATMSLRERRKILKELENIKKALPLAKQKGSATQKLIEKQTNEFKLGKGSFSAQVKETLAIDDEMKREYLALFVEGVDLIKKYGEKDNVPKKLEDKLEKRFDELIEKAKTKGIDLDAWLDEHKEELEKIFDVEKESEEKDLSSVEDES